MPSPVRPLRRIDVKLPDTGGGAIVPPGGGAPAGAPSVGVPGTPQSVRIVSTFLLHGQGQGLAGANVAWAAPTGTSPDSYLVQWDVTSGFTAPTTRTAPRGQLSIALDAMPTGATVYVRVAAVLGGVQGAWSATASAATPSDTTPPAPVTGLSFSWSGLTGDLTISWTNPTSANLRDVRVRIYASNGGAMLREVFWPGQSYVWTRGQQFADTGGAFDPSVYVVVTARSWGGSFSTDATGTATLSPPATPAGLTHSWAGDAGTAGAGLLVTWTLSSAVAGYRLSVDGTARDVGLTGRYEYGFTQNQAEHSGTADPVLSLSLVAVDALGQTSGAATATATNVAPPATTITVFPAFDRAGLTIGASAAQDIKDYRVRVYVASVLVDTFFTTDTKVLYQAANGNGSYQFDVAARDVFGQIGAASSLTAAETLEDVGAFVASLRAGAIYSDQLGTNGETLFDAYTDDNRASGGVSYASNAGWVRWIRFERPERDRYRTITLSMSPASGTTSWYIRTSEDGATWAYYAGPVTSGRILTSVASAAAAQSAAVSAATLGGPTTSRVDLPSIVSARYVEVWLRNTGAATTVREFYPRRLVQSDDLEAEAVKAVNIAASAITAGAIAAGAIDGFVITGATIRTAASGARIEMSGSSLFAVDSGGVARVEITPDGLLTRDSLGNIQVQATAATNGALYVGQGNTRMDRFGVRMISTGTVSYSALDSTRAVTFRNTSDASNIGYLTAFNDTSFSNKILLHGLSSATRPAEIELVANSTNTIGNGGGKFVAYGGTDAAGATSYAYALGGTAAIYCYAGGTADVGSFLGNANATINLYGATATAGNVAIRGAPNSQTALRVLSPSDSSLYPLIIQNAAGTLTLLYIQSLSSSTCEAWVADTAWTYASDDRMKERLRPLEGGALARLGRLAPKRFLYKGDGREHVGFVAQEVRDIYPELVSENAEGVLGLRTTDLIPELVSALGELAARLDALEGRPR